MAERSKRTTTFIFLFSIFILLAVIVFVWLYSSSTESEEFVKEESASLFSCVEIMFNVPAETIAYDNGQLTFRIYNTGSANIEKIDIFSKDIKIEKNFTKFYPGYKSFRIVSVDIADLDAFSVMANNCEQTKKGFTR